MAGSSSTLSGMVLSDPIVVGAGVVLFVMVFATAAWHKWADRQAFAMTASAYRLVPAPLIGALTAGLAALEAVLIPALTWPATRPPAFGFAAVLLLGYALAMAINLLRGRADIDCGCGGHAQRLSWALVARNVVLAALALCWLQPVGMRALDVTDAMLLIAVASSFCALYHLADELIRQATRLGALKRALQEEH